MAFCGISLLFLSSSSIAASNKAIASFALSYFFAICPYSSTNCCHLSSSDCCMPAKAACRGLEAISPWILLSVRQGKSFDTLAVRWELGEIEKPPFCRTDFYSCRRRFFANLDKQELFFKPFTLPGQVAGQFLQGCLALHHAIPMKIYHMKRGCIYSAAGVPHNLGEGCREFPAGCL